MGKTVDELNLDDKPLPAVQVPDVRDTEWYRFSRQIDDLLASVDYAWAADTLTSIQESVEQYRTVTDGQRRAVANIEAARTRRSSRRYEGYGWRYRR